MQHILLFGKPLRAFSTKVGRESTNWPRVMNSGTHACDKQTSTVIMKRIGQSACSLPNGAMIANGRASETERIWVTNDGLINQRWLKIQSIPLWKHRGIRVLTAISCKSYTKNNKNSFIFKPNISLYLLFAQRSVIKCTNDLDLQRFKNTAYIINADMLFAILLRSDPPPFLTTGSACKCLSNRINANTNNS